MVQQDSDLSSDSEEEEEIAFFSKRDKGPRFVMEEYGKEKFEQLFRFGKLGFERLLLGLQFPTQYHCSQKTITTSREALLILLRRLAYPNWWCNLVTRFSRTESEMSLIFKEILDDIHHRFCYLLEVWLDPHCFAKAVQDAGAPLDNC